MTHIDPATPAVDPVELIARYLDDVALDAVANRAAPTAKRLRAAATELLDDLLAGDEPEPPPAPPAVERDTDAVRIVEHILATHTHPRPIADAIVDALFGIPTVTRHDDGHLTVDWHDTPTHRPRACIVARDLLDEIAEQLNSDPVDDYATGGYCVSHTMVDDEGVMLDVVTRVSPPYVVLLATHDTRAPGTVFGLDVPATRRLAARLINAANAMPDVELSPDCKAEKCHACNGDAWSDVLDARTDCAHPCHLPAAPLPERTAMLGDVLPPLPNECYPPGSVPLPEPDVTQ